MKKTFLLLAFALFGFVLGTVQAEQRVYVMPRNVEELKAKTLAAPSGDAVWTVFHADLVDWGTLLPEKYDKIYAQISDEFFLSQFSLKRGFHLEPFFPLLFPKTPDALKMAAPEILEKLSEVKTAVNQTLHEIHTEFFLLPLVTWCKENQVSLEYEMRPDAYVPAAFLIEDAQVVRRICVENGRFGEGTKSLESEETVKNGGLDEALANSSSRQNGRLELQGRPVVYSKDGTVLLIPDSVVCGEVEKIPGALDFLAEFQVRYVTVTLGKNGPEAGFGAASWKTVQLMRPRERYSPESQKFLKRFEEFGGKVVE
ncbi:MAG: hypothetical protein K6C40_03720 [Thermoguttaceae bacterium]|nr:hypothetical protein [Thermoguttaceae bacterium]